MADSSSAAMQTLLPDLQLGFYRWLLLVMSIIATGSIVTAHASSPPNIVLIVADDMGWKDIGYNGSEIRTPSLDRLAAVGVRLDRFYVQPSCSPTRASLMTGQSAVRTGVTRAFLAVATGSLPLNLRIMPQYLADVGYQTFLSGKWHLGHRNKAMLPLARGFDRAYGFLTGGIGYWDHNSAGGHDWHRDELPLREKGYSTHLIAAEAIRFIESRDKNRPLFLYVAFSAPHLPNEAPADTIASYDHIKDHRRRVHAAMVEEMDSAIGGIVSSIL